MSTEIAYQVGRGEAKFNPIADTHRRPVDKFYDVKPQRRSPAPHFEKCSGRGDEELLRTRGSALDYNPNPSVAKPRILSHTFSSTSRGLDPEGSDAEKDRRKRYKQMQDELRLKERQAREAQRRQARQRSNLSFSSMLGRDSTVVGGSPLPLPLDGPVTPREGKEEDREKLTKRRITGGRIGKAERSAVMVPKPDSRDYNAQFKPLRRNVGGINMKRAAGRELSPKLGVAGLTPHTNRLQLNRLLKEVDSVADTEGGSVFSVHSPSPSVRCLDFYLGGGRSEIFVQGQVPQHELQVGESLNDVTCQSDRLRVQLQNMEQQEGLQRKLKKKKTSGVQSLYRLSENDDYKLKKYYKIFQDREINRLGEELRVYNNDNINIGGSMYRISLLANQKQARRLPAADLPTIEADDEDFADE